MESKLFYTAPAKNWNEALPLGNGSLGGMVYGGVPAETIALNLDTLWSGHPKNKTPQDLTAYYRAASALAMKGQYLEAQQILEEHLCSEFDEGYLPMGQLLAEDLAAGETTEYTRTLDLETGVHTVRYRKNGVPILRECFASSPDNALVLHITAEEPVLGVKLQLASELRGKTHLQDDALLFAGECPTHVEPNYVESAHPIQYDDAEGLHGIGFCFGIAVCTDGEMQCSGKAILVTGASEITIFLAAGNSFAGYDKDPYDPEKRYITRCAQHLAALQNQPYAGVKAAHIADYRQLEQRCGLDLAHEGRYTTIPTDERLRRFEADPTDLGLVELLFRYGRYLLLSSSRRGSQAANLQGIWNSALRAPWCSNYTLNINTEMNYWPVYMANLTECALPLIALVQELAETGAVAAKNLYGAKGWVSHHNTDLWRATNPVGNFQKGSACYGFWPMSAAWLCRPVFEYYEYTKDCDYLQNTAYPLLKGAAEFILSVLQTDENGQVILCPATSPENNFLAEGKQISVSKSTTMAQSIAWDLLTNCHKACNILGLDAAFDAQIAEALDHLKLPEIGADGRLLEWHEEVEEAELHHRHISHLYGLHPGRQITPGTTPALAEACRKSLETRGDAGTGWSLAWKINAWARLQDGDRAEKLLRQQLHAVASTVTDNFAGGGTYPNFFCAHPPFQIDGNFGAVSGILEMLVQSGDGIITLLPALPTAWPSGTLTGVRAHGGYTLSLTWANHALKTVTVTADTDGPCTLCYKGKPYTLACTAGIGTEKQF